MWTNRYAGPGRSADEASSIAVGSNGNVCVTGFSIDFNGSYDYATISYSSVGIPLWTNRYNGLGNGADIANSIAVGGNGNVYVTGYSDTTYGNNNDYATIAYSSAGIPIWTNRYNGPGNSYDQAKGVAVGGDGNVYVTGSSVGSGSDTDYATIAYSSVGLPLWTNRYNGLGNGNDYANSIAVGSNGNVYVTGYSSDASGSSDYVTIDYSSTGQPLWTNRYNGPENSDDIASSIAVGGNGNISDASPM